MPKKRKHFAVIIGARPNFIKVAPFLHEAKRRPEYDVTLIHTGQHYDQNMSQVFFDEMGIQKPDVFLQIVGEHHTEKIGRMFNILKTHLLSMRPDGLVVFGDVNSTLAGAIASVKNDVPLVHIEAGLRSHDRRMPEEINRVIVDHLSDHLFTSEPSAKENLVREGVNTDRIHFVGNIMLECMEMFWEDITASSVLTRFGLLPKKYLVATIHRQENTDDPHVLKKILELLATLTIDSKVVMPMHPGTKHKIAQYDLEHILASLTIIEPISYFDFVKLIADSGGVITDSGGIQEETTHLGIPCATLRDNTERPITLTKNLGSNKLFSAEPEARADIIAHLTRRDFNSRHVPLWGKGVSARIFDRL